jgi:hypothetical protein
MDQRHIFRRRRRRRVDRTSENQFRILQSSGLFLCSFVLLGVLEFEVSFVYARCFFVPSPQVSYFNWDATSLPFRVASVDIIFSDLPFGHVRNSISVCIFLMFWILTIMLRWCVCVFLSETW